MTISQRSWFRYHTQKLTNKLEIDDEYQSSNVMSYDSRPASIILLLPAKDKTKNGTLTSRGKWATKAALAS
ncbi:hypothetical protein NC653_030214 [Populus alba x Populus x berolinensis]|uniref:Uncharacterized protein n=1 Tax=Populus alba x Populus x berolinensis TaxID=444605 RepID=A0AAD6Q197_9ROSI|nr:hypothetical protein NC653_030214 [Populus alba x Populus x berolinensis]